MSSPSHEPSWYQQVASEVQEAQGMKRPWGCSTAATAQTQHLLGFSSQHPLRTSCRVSSDKSPGSFPLSLTPLIFPRAAFVPLAELPGNHFTASRRLQVCTFSRSPTCCLAYLALPSLSRRNKRADLHVQCSNPAFTIKEPPKTPCSS